MASILVRVAEDSRVRREYGLLRLISKLLKDLRGTGIEETDWRKKCGRR